jgi:hypothetical protein
VPAHRGRERLVPHSALNTPGAPGVHHPNGACRRVGGSPEAPVDCDALGQALRSAHEDEGPLPRAAGQPGGGQGHDVVAVDRDGLDPRVRGLDRGGRACADADQAVLSTGEEQAGSGGEGAG